MLLIPDIGTLQKKTGIILCILVRRQGKGNNEEREDRLEVVAEGRIVLL